MQDAQVSDQESARKRNRQDWDFFGILLIERRSDLLAATAFLLSVFTILLNIFFYSRGASIQMIPPKFVTLAFEEYPDGVKYLVVDVALGYVNTAAVGYSGIVVDEYADVRVGKKRYCLSTYSFRDASATRIDPARDRLPPLGLAHPTVVPGNSGVLRFISLGPVPGERSICEAPDTSADSSYVDRPDFLIALSSAIGDRSDEESEAVLDISIFADFYDESKKGVVCQASAGSSTLELLSLGIPAMLVCVVET